VSVNAELEGDKPNIVSVTTLVAAVRMGGEPEMDGDNLECILANLIYDGFVKGYIAHAKAVVFKKPDGKSDAFPDISMVTSTLYPSS
jgi:hypothetical protein